jgi:hypothetical protein
VSDIDTAAVDSLKALDPERPIREATEIASATTFTARSGTLANFRPAITA